jgi:hypothetical protein
VADAIELRRAETTDSSAIRRLTRRAYAKWVHAIGREAKPMTADYEAAVAKHRFDLLYVGDILAGLIETLDEGDRLRIENVVGLARFPKARPRVEALGAC